MMMGIWCALLLVYIRFDHHQVCVCKVLVFLLLFLHLSCDGDVCARGGITCVMRADAVFLVCVYANRSDAARLLADGLMFLRARTRSAHHGWHRAWWVPAKCTQSASFALHTRAIHWGLIHTIPPTRNRCDSRISIGRLGFAIYEYISMFLLTHTHVHARGKTGIYYICWAAQTRRQEWQTLSSSTVVI